MENRVSNSQLDELLDYLLVHTTLAKGVGMGSRSKENIDKEWNYLAQKFNSHGSGTSKSGQRWKRYWADLKHKAKARASARRQEASVTGGGPSSHQDLSETDKKIMAIIGDAAIYGDTQHRVPIIPNQSEIIEITPVHISDNEHLPESPSRTGHTSVKFSTAELLDVRHPAPEDVCVEPTEMASPTTSRPAGRRILQSTNKSNRTKVENSWVIDLENRRIAAEEKIADAIMIIAEAAKTNAETARLNAEANKAMWDMMAKLIKK